MSTRTLFESNKVEYLLPTSAGAQVGDVLQLAAGGQLEFAAGGGGGGLTQEDVYGPTGAIYPLPVLAAATANQVMTVQNIDGTNVVQFVNPQAGGLTSAEVYGTGAPYALPVLADAAPNTVMTVAENAGQKSVVFSAQNQGLSVEDVFGTGNIYQLPAIGADNTVATVAGGALTYAPLPAALNAGQVWANTAIPYLLPNITGVNNGLSLVSNGNSLEFFNVLGDQLTQEQVYGAGNAPYSLGPIAPAAEGAVLTAVGGSAVWQAPAGGVTSGQVWANPGAQAKIPDYTGGPTAGAVLTLTNDADGTTSWVQPPGVPAANIWTAPNDPYKLPAIGNEGQYLAVSATPGVLEYQNPPTISTTTATFNYTVAFATAVEPIPAYITFSKTGSMVVCSLACDAFSSDGVTGGNLASIVFTPAAGQPQIANYMPSTSPNPMYLGTTLITQTAGAGNPSAAQGWLYLTPNNFNFVWNAYDGTGPTTSSTYVVGSGLGSTVQAGAWVVQTA